MTRTIVVLSFLLSAALASPVSRSQDRESADFTILDAQGNSLAPALDLTPGDGQTRSPGALSALLRAGPSPTQRRRILAQWIDAVPGVDFVEREILVGFRPQFVGRFRAPGRDLSGEQAQALHEVLRDVASRFAAERGYTLLDTSPELRLALMELGPQSSLLEEMRAVRTAIRVEVEFDEGLCIQTLEIERGEKRAV